MRWVVWFTAALAGSVTFRLSVEAVWPTAPDWYLLIVGLLGVVAAEWVLGHAWRFLRHEPFELHATLAGRRMLILRLPRGRG